MKDLIRLAEEKGWDYNEDAIKFGIPKKPNISLNAQGELVSDTPEHIRVEVAYYTMRQIERWLMNKHDICIAVNYIVSNGVRRYNYFINYPNREPEMTFHTKQPVSTYDGALYNAIKIALKTLPNI